MPELAAYVNADRTRPEFLATRSDADLNGDHKASGKELDIAATWESSNFIKQEIARVTASQFYITLQKIASASWNTAIGQDGERHLILQVTNPDPMPNDFLVSYSSAIPDSITQNVFKLALTYEGKTGKMHGNIADGQTANDLWRNKHVPARK